MCEYEGNDQVKQKANHMYLKFDAKSVNEGFARMAVAAFMVELNPTLEEIADVKTAVSEAVTNSIVHGYPKMKGEVELVCEYHGSCIRISISDQGIGIENIDEAMQPFYTSKPEMERSGMGFAFMEAFMDSLEVQSIKGKGTTIVMTKHIKGECGE